MILVEFMKIYYTFLNTYVLHCIDMNMLITNIFRVKASLELVIVYDDKNMSTETKIIYNKSFYNIALVTPFCYI